MIQDMMLRMSVWVNDALGRVRSDERGQGITEYAILLGAIALIASFVFFAAGGFNASFQTMKNEIQSCVTFSNTCG